MRSDVTVCWGWTRFIVHHVNVFGYNGFDRLDPSPSSNVCIVWQPSLFTPRGSWHWDSEKRIGDHHLHHHHISNHHKLAPPPWGTSPSHQPLPNHLLYPRIPIQKHKFSIITISLPAPRVQLVKCNRKYEPACAAETNRWVCCSAHSSAWLFLLSL